MDLIGLADLGAAVARFSDPTLFGWILVGVLIGTVFGAAPGLTATAVSLSRH